MGDLENQYVSGTASYDSVLGFALKHALKNAELEVGNELRWFNISPNGTSISEKIDILTQKYNANTTHINVVTFVLGKIRNLMDASANGQLDAMKSVVEDLMQIGNVTINLSDESQVIANVFAIVTLRLNALRMSAERNGVVQSAVSL